MAASDDKANRELATGFEVFLAPEKNRLADGTKQGKPFGRYLLLRPLGRGGMGVVVEAEDTTLRRRVAIKILSKSVSDDGDRLKRLLNEARAATGFSIFRQGLTQSREDAASQSLIALGTRQNDGAMRKNIVACGCLRPAYPVV